MLIFPEYPFQDGKIISTAHPKDGGNSIARFRLGKFSLEPPPDCKSPCMLSFTSSWEPIHLG